MKELGWLNVSIDEAAHTALQSKEDFYLSIQIFFTEVHQSDIRVLFILDEFDNARYLFKNDTSAFQQLRELSYNPESHVTFITTSRRTIYDIEIQTQAISTFDGIFHKHYLNMFNEPDLQAYFSRFNEVGITIDTTLVGTIQNYAGGHPHLLGMLGYEIIESFQEGTALNIENVLQFLQISVIEYYDRLVRLLREDGYLKKLLQLLYGPLIDVRKTDIDALLRFGLIKIGDKNNYEAFSSHFQSFLGLIAREEDIWPIWCETEKALRRTISQVLEHAYGENWFERLEKKHSQMSIANGKNLFQRCREAQQREWKSWGDRASSNLLDFTYPQDLLEIVQREWKGTPFESIFGKDRHYWQERAKLLSKVRNPLAHNRDEVLHDHDRYLAEAYCHEILDALHKARENPALDYLD